MNEDEIRKTTQFSGMNVMDSANSFWLREIAAQIAHLGYVIGTSIDDWGEELKEIRILLEHQSIKKVTQATKVTVKKGEQG